MSPLRNKAFVDAAVLFVLFLIGWLYFSRIEAFELLVEFVEAHEAWELDELITSLMLLGIAGFIFALRRFNDARGELRAREAAEANVQWLAQNDSLTELPNRRFLKGFVQSFDASARRRGKSVSHAVFSIDLDGFKQVNDLYGHHGGDLVLKEVARRLVNLADDDLVLRLGGDEFLIVAALDNEEQAQTLARDVVEAVGRPMDVDGVHAEVGASVGFVLCPDQVASLEEAVRCSDAALYATKRSTTTSFMAFDASMADESKARARLENDLRVALREGDIHPFYQPLFDLGSDDICGFEVLARWTKPDGQSVPPSVFIPLAEQAGLISELSEQMLTKACHDARTRPDHLKLSFNLSPTQLADRSIGLRLISILEKARFLPQRLEIEVTESAMVQDASLALQVLNELKAAGIQTVLDDFGTGYSSLSQIARFNFDRIKIDRSFVAEFQQNDKQHSIIKAIIALSQGLNISTTAEGVEDESQLEALKSLGCHAGQGYLLGRPMPAADVETLVLGDDAKEVLARSA